MTTPVESKYELSQQINDLENWQVDLSLINKFVAYLREVYCIPVSWNVPNQVHLDDLSRRFKQVLNARDELSVVRPID